MFERGGELLNKDLPCIRMPEYARTLSELDTRNQQAGKPVLPCSRSLKSMYVNKNGTELWQPLSLGKTLNFHENGIVMCSMGILSTETLNNFSFLKSSQNQVAVSSVRHSTVSLHLPFHCLHSLTLPFKGNMS